MSLPHLAYIGLLPGVDPHVGHQFVLGIEGPRAPVAAVPVTGKLLAALPELLVAGLRCAYPLDVSLIPPATLAATHVGED